MKIGIAGYSQTAANYEVFLKTVRDVEPVISLSVSELDRCRAILLPGGGDIDPIFWGERNKGSRSIDTVLDLRQFTILEHCIKKQIPVLGICKGMQLINVALGGTLQQHIPYACHYYLGRDQYHPVLHQKGCFLNTLYGAEAIVNSAHHQALDRLGEHLTAVSRCPFDACIEAICHDTLPLWGLQWHPERLDPSKTTLDGTLLLRSFLALL